MKTDTLTERTKGEWKANFYIHEVSIYSPSAKEGIAKLQYHKLNYSPNKVEANAKFICKAVNNYDALLSMLKEVKYKLALYISDSIAANTDDYELLEDAEKLIKKAEGNE